MTKINYRKIYEQNFGSIPKGYHIHHKDFNHKNNDPYNLEALSPDEHAKKHGFLNNFIMSQAKACELAKIRLKQDDMKLKMKIAMLRSKKHKQAIKKRNTKEYINKMKEVAKLTTLKRKKYEVWNKGKKGLQKHTEETKRLYTIQRTGRKWFNDGVKEYFTFKSKKNWNIGRII